MPESLHICVEKAKQGGYIARIEGDPDEKALPCDLQFLRRSKRILDGLAGFEINQFNHDKIREVGAELFSALFNEHLHDAYVQLRDASSQENPTTLKLTIPDTLSTTPWETLYEDLAAEPFFAVRRHMSFVREVDIMGVPPAQGVPGDSLSMLVVIPDGSGLNAPQELQNIQRIAASTGGRVTVERLSGRVTPTLLREKLNERQWDIVHFIGHGELSEESFFVILNGDQVLELPVEGQTFASLFVEKPPRLVVLNCCSGSAASTGRTLSTVGPALLRTGVTAVLAMRYEVSDDAAIAFTEAFYRELLNRDSPNQGMVEIAATAARRSLYVNGGDGNLRAFFTPVLFISKWYRRLLAPPGRLVAPIAPPPPPSSPPEYSYSDEFRECLADLKRQDCVVVLGPGILNAARNRNAVPIPTLRDVLRKLAGECGFPLPDDVVLDDVTVAMLLPWVCQQYQQSLQRLNLLKSIMKIYEGIEPPGALAAIGKLGPPAIVYTHFDGLLETALRGARTEFKVLSSMQEESDLTHCGTLLLCPTGNARSPESLVLTEEEHEQLYDEIGKLSPVVRAHLRGKLGRSALFIGVSPRDVLTRRLAARFLDPGERRTQGPTYFVSSQPSAADEGYWKKYGVCWLEESLDKVCEALVRGDA